MAGKEAGFPAPDPSLPPDLCFYPACETKLVFFEGAPPHNLRHPQKVTWLLNSTRLPSATEAAPARYRIATQQLWAHNLAVGDRVAIASRRCGGCTYQLIHSANFTTTDLSIHGSCNMAVWEIGGLGADVFRLVRHGNEMLSHGSAAHARFFEAASRKSLRTMHHADGWVMSAAWHAPSARLVTGAHAGILCVWEARTGTLLKRFDAWPQARR